MARGRRDRSRRRQFPGDDAQWDEFGRFARSEEGKAYFRDDPPIGPDGSFRLEGVPQGSYQLQVWSKGPDEPGTTRLEAGTEFEVPATPEGRSDEPLDLGALPLRERTP